MKVKEKLIRVALYIRVSTDRQAKEGDSLEAQEKALTDYAKEHNYIIFDTYIDGGESGQKIKRTNLQRMLKDVECNKIDLVIMTKLDRWFRNVSDFYKVIEILKKNKVDWKTIWEDYDTTTASGEFWLNMSLALGQMEAKRTGERISEIFEHKYKFQKTVCSGKKKYGYDISEEKKYIINEEEAQNVNDLYDHFIDTESIRETAIWFRENKRNICHASIKNYLKDISYTGKYYREKTGELIDDFIPAIITEEKFNKAQKIFERNIKNYTRPFENYKNDYIFSGLLRCSKCGNRLAGSRNNSGNKYYRCKKYTVGECTEKKMLNEKRIEKYLLNNIVHLCNTKFNGAILKERENQKKQIDIKTIKNKMNKLTDLYLNDMIDKDYYNTEYIKLKNQLSMEEKKANTDVINLEKKKEVERLLNEYLPTVYNTLSDNEKRLLWGRIFNYSIITIKNKDDFSMEIIVD